MQTQEVAKAVTQNQDSLLVPGLKIGSAWGAVGITSWADAASFLAALYTFLLVLEWLWKRAVRPFCEERGWLKRSKRRKDDAVIE